MKSFQASKKAQANGNGKRNEQWQNAHPKRRRSGCNGQERKKGIRAK